jgi:dTDP-4-dehydrorhamnose 3,5-epimerase
MTATELICESVTKQVGAKLQNSGVQNLAVRASPLPGVILLEPTVHADGRGFFLETYNRQAYAACGISLEFVQDNQSRSTKGVLRGFHYQDMSAPMAKLVRCSFGTVLDAVVDLRLGAPTFGHVYSVELSGENHRQLLVPVGFGHAFLVLSEVADVEYKCSGYYAPSAEGTVAWNDPEIGMRWPVGTPNLSAKDARGMTLADYRRRPAFSYEGGA